VKKMDPERRRRLVALAEWHREWVARHQQAADEAYDPSKWPGVRDYHEHYVDLEAPAEAQEEFHSRARQIMGIDHR
jgi:hypothetical protein